MATKNSTKAPARPRRSKAETQREFAEIQEEVEAAQQTLDAKTIEATRLREAQVRHRLEGVSVEMVVQKISALGLEVSRALADVSEKLTEEVQLLAIVREAVTLERKELEHLHKIDVAATALDQLVQDYAREKQKLEEEITAQREAWEKDTARLERERKEQEETLKKQRQREIDDYEYKKILDRKKAQDKYEEELRVRDMKNQEQQEALEKGWQRREAVLKEREEEPSASSSVSTWALARSWPTNSSFSSSSRVACITIENWPPMSGVISAVTYWMGKGTGGILPAAMSRFMEFSVLHDRRPRYSGGGQQGGAGDKHTRPTVRRNLDGKGINGGMS